MNIKQNRKLIMSHKTALTWTKEKFDYVVVKMENVYYKKLSPFKKIINRLNFVKHYFYTRYFFETYLIIRSKKEKLKRFLNKDLTYRNF